VTRDDVIEIIAELIENYPSFDDSEDNIDRHYKYLQDFPFEAAMKNVQEYIKTNRFPPTIADIRGRLGDQMDSQRSKDAAAAHFESLDSWSANDEPPPAGYWESMKEKLRGDADA
jgi:Loader and inhibitor of phage G40P.